MSNNSFSNQIKKKTSEKYTLVAGELKGYNHTTFTVSSLSEYIDLIHLISGISDCTDSGDTIVFRGTADKDYKLLPGISRIKSVEENLERSLVCEYLTRCPEAFYGLTEFDMIAKMQHYGLPTRLLDFTLNPLVALFFACSTKPSKDGRVLCHNTFLQNFSSTLINRVSEKVVNKDFDQNYTLNEYMCDDRLSFRKYINDVYLCGTTTVVRPKYWNQRIMNQEGVFMFFLNTVYDRFFPVLVNAREIGVEKAIRQYGWGDINEKKLRTAMEIEPIDKYIRIGKNHLTREILLVMRDAYSEAGCEDEYFWEMLKDRVFFGGVINHMKSIKNNNGLNSLLGELDDMSISNNFCSIIIESKNKKRLLQELSTVGIRSDYIYPELEYSAKEIRRLYGMNY